MHLWQVMQCLQGGSTIGEIAHRELADDPWVDCSRSGFKERDQGGIAVPKVIDPDRSVDEDLAGSDCRRGGTERGPVASRPSR